MDVLKLLGIVACVMFGAIGTVALLSTGWGIILIPFWIAGFGKLTMRLTDALMEAGSGPSGGSSVN